jgi:hypothetical protein
MVGRMCVWHETIEQNMIAQLETLAIGSQGLDYLDYDDCKHYILSFETTVQPWLHYLKYIITEQLFVVHMKLTSRPPE